MYEDRLVGKLSGTQHAACGMPPASVHARPAIYRACSSYYICVLILLHMCPHTTTYVSSYYYICVLILLHMSPHTTAYVSAYSCRKAGLVHSVRRHPPASVLASAARHGHKQRGAPGPPRLLRSQGTQFTCFTCFTSTKVQVLTLREHAAYFCTCVRGSEAAARAWPPLRCARQGVHGWRASGVWQVDARAV